VFTITIQKNYSIAHFSEWNCNIWQTKFAVALGHPLGNAPAADPICSIKEFYI